MANFDPQNELVRNRALKIQTLHIPFTITGSATSANVVSSSDEPALFFVATQGLDQITGALASGESAPTFSSKSDSGGNFAILVKISEPVVKVTDALVILTNTGTNGVKNCSVANTTGLTANKDKLVLNALTGIDLTAGNITGTLVVSYSV